MLADMIKEVRVNILLLIMWKRNLKYGKMLKDFVAHNHIVGDLYSIKEVVVSDHCFAIIERKLPP